MVTSMNRAIGPGFNAEQKQSGIKLELLKDHVMNSKILKAGQVIEVTKSEARRLLIARKDLFKIAMD